VGQIRDRVYAIRERFRQLVREKKTQDEIVATMTKEFNWGTGPADASVDQKNRHSYTTRTRSSHSTCLMRRRLV